MGFDGSGGYNRVHNWVTDKNAAVKITASRMDAEFDDFASAMALCLVKDGQQNPTANLPMNSKKHTGVDGASARSDYVDLGSYVDGKFVFGGVASGTSAITVVLSPVITAYTTGMRVGFLCVGDNASAVTLNVDGVSAAALIKGKNSPLVANDLLSGQAVWATYKGTLGWQISEQISDSPTFVSLTTTGQTNLRSNVSISGTLDVAGAVSLAGATDITGAVSINSTLVVAGAVSCAAAFSQSDNVFPASAGAANNLIVTDGSGSLKWQTDGTLWTNTGQIDLTSGSPTSVSLASSLVSVNEIEINIIDFSTNTANQSPLIQIGDSGGLETSGYAGEGFRQDAALGATTANGEGFLIGDDAVQDAAQVARFSIVLRHMGSNVWVMSSMGQVDSNSLIGGEGTKTLSAVLDRVSITTTGGTATFDGGTAYIRSR